MGKMETQRRQQGVDCEVRVAGGDVNGQFATRQAGNCRQGKLERTAVQTSAGQIEKDTPIPLAFVPARMLMIAAARRPALVGARTRVGVQRYDRRWHRAFLVTCVRMMPAAAEHGMQGQEDGDQRWEQSVRHGFRRRIGERNRPFRLP
jgi:hypothetical protein